MKRILLVFAASIAIVIATLGYSRSRVASAPQPVLIDDTSFCLIHIDSVIQADSLIESYVRPYHDSIEGKMSQKLCICDVEMAARHPESELTRLLSDILLHETQLIAKEKKWPEPQFSLMNVGGMRSALHSGEVTMYDVFQISPFENKSVVVKLDSAGVMAMFKRLGERGGEAISGATATLATDGTISDIRIAGKPICGTETYRLATIDYLATGGEGFDCLVDNVEYETGVLYRDILAQSFIRSGNLGVHLVAPTDERLHIIDNKTTDRR